MPAGACDTHFHIFPAGHEHRYVTDRSYTPPALEISDFDNIARSLRIERAVVVQASVYGEDNTATLEVVSANPERLRAVISIDKDATDSDLASYHAQGVRGIRVNVVDSGGMTFSSIDEALAFTARIKDFGWHIEFLAHVETFEDIGSILAASHVPVVFGHLGYTKVTKGTDDIGFQRFLDAFQEGAVWVKLTGPYRISNLDRFPYSDVTNMAQALIEANPDRLLWGSDWPHVRHVGVMPNDTDLLEQLSSWGCDASLRKQILVDNPAFLYGF
jgi:predicted TIM-barrel fold metal-dependent hydrolase|tara:strand:+ start:322 stop:1140 length:819 start_codon:yes stop_codon:yes gene_type:complete